MALSGRGAPLVGSLLVCTVTEAAGRAGVKLFDNPAKATGDPAEIARYLPVFGGAGRLSRGLSV